MSVEYGSWDFDMSRAPTGKTVKRSINTKDGVKEYDACEQEDVILASKCGKVTRSYWIPKEARWCMFAKGEEPVAWQMWPKHPSPPKQD